MTTTSTRSTPRSQPERIRPTPLAGVEIDGQKVSATLAPASWNVIRLTGGG